MKSSIVIAALLICSNAVACELSLVTPVTSALKNPVEAHVSLADDALIARFSVLAPSLNAKKVLAPGEYPYQFDVVELSKPRKKWTCRRHEEDLCALFERLNTSRRESVNSIPAAFLRVTVTVP